MAKDVIGYRPCPDCDTRATVHWAAGRRQALYQQCECTCVQHNGALHQSRLWYETTWLDGLKPENQPRKVLEKSEYLTRLKAATERNRVLVDSQETASEAVPDLENSDDEEIELDSQQAAKEAVTETDPDLKIEQETEAPAEAPAEPKKKRKRWVKVVMVAGLGTLAALVTAIARS
ncbi:MAG: hypothetical protein COA96_14140 [SAR86 cluster bacterium]|uniref:Uncharacterized protein n=1 Tax=SAR86 cluster bacterium TaxID=2030880 RepID=A0A2A5ATF1_9GAMM|nr:MAG: hypothetical protein COA96_14140 [SAR86 cluster bacterium]